MTHSSIDPLPAKTCPRWLRVLLVVSLALNLLIIGVIGGVALTWEGKHRGHHPSRLEQVGGPLTRALSKEDRRAIRRDMRAAYEGRSGDRRTQKALMQSLIDDLRKSPFDRAAVTGHMAAQRALVEERLTLGQTILLDRLAAMSPEDRTAYANRLQEVLERRRDAKKR